MFDVGKHCGFDIRQVLTLLIKQYDRSSSNLYRYKQLSSFSIRPSVRSNFLFTNFQKELVYSTLHLTLLHGVQTKTGRTEMCCNHDGFDRTFLIFFGWNKQWHLWGEPVFRVERIFNCNNFAKRKGCYIPAIL